MSTANPTTIETRRRAAYRKTHFSTARPAVLLLLRFRESIINENLSLVFRLSFYVIIPDRGWDYKCLRLSVCP